MSIHKPSSWCRLYVRPVNFGQEDVTRLLAIEGEPVSFKVTRSDHRKAGTFDLEFDFEDFPFDPRLIQGITVEIFLNDLVDYDIQELEHSDANGFWEDLTTSEQNEFAIFAGVADTLDAKFDDDGRIFKVTGRDYTAYFLDARFNREILWGAKSFVTIVREIVGFRDTTRALNIEIRTEDGSLVLPSIPTDASDTFILPADLPGKVLDILAVQPKDYKPAARSATSSKRMPRAQEVIWEALQEVALEAGLFIDVELDRVVIHSPRNLAVDNLPSDRQIIYTIGQNIDFEQRRDLGRQSSVAVQVTCLDTESGTRLKAIAPSDAAELASQKEVSAPGAAGPIGDELSKKGVAQKNVSVVPFVVRNITSQSQMQAIADALLAQIRNHDLEITLSTSEMHDSLGRPCWTYNYTDPVDVDIADSLTDSILIEEPEEQIKRLERLGFKVKDAQALVGDPSNPNDGFLGRFAVPFILSEIVYSYNDDGFDLVLTLRSRKHVVITDADAIAEGG